MIGIIILLLILCMRSNALTCSVTLTVTSAAINPGNDNTFTVTLNPVGACAGTPVNFEVIDPMNVKHEYRGITDAAASISTTYLKVFDKNPNTDISGRYYVVARSLGSLDEGDFIVNVAACDEEIYLGNTLAERQITIGSRPSASPSDIVACCNMPCCYDLNLDINCNKVGGSFPVAELNVGITNPASFGYNALCRRILSGSTVQYTSINASKYLVVGEFRKTNGEDYWIVDIGEDGCIWGGTEDDLECGLTTDRLFIDKNLYKVYVLNELAYADVLCRGFYTSSIPWPYDWEQNTSRYLAVYGDMTDFLYCHLAPQLIRDSKWCHLVNLGWYLVVNLTNERNVTYITPENIGGEKEWNNLSGYIVLGHACPFDWNISSLDVCGPRKLIIANPNSGSTFEIGYSIDFDADLSGSYGSAVCIPPMFPPPAFKWDFGDGGIAFGQNVNHAYAVQGIYTVTLEVTYPGIPGFAEDSITVTIIDPSPLPFIFAPLSVSIIKPLDGLYIIAGANINFEGVVAGGTPPVFNENWDFGDAATALGVTAVHPYAAIGIYVVTFSAQDSLPSVDSDTITINVVNWAPRIINAKCEDITDGPTLPHFEHETKFDFEIWNPHNANSINNVITTVTAMDYMDCDFDNINWLWNLGNIAPLDSFYIIHNNFCDEDAGNVIKFEINIIAANPPPGTWTYCATCPNADGSDCTIAAGSC